MSNFHHIWHGHNYKHINYQLKVEEDSWSFSYIIFKLQSSCYHTSRKGNEDRKTKQHINMIYNILW